MNKQSVYLVHGECGEYDGRQEWFVCAYTAKETAQQHVAALNQWIRTWLSGSAFSPGYITDCPYDPYCRTDFSGTKYQVIEVPLVAHLDQFIEHWMR